MPRQEVIAQSSLTVSEATSAKCPPPLLRIQKLLGASQHFHDELLRSADALPTKNPAFVGVIDITPERTEGVDVKRLQQAVIDAAWKTRTILFRAAACITGS